MAEENKTEENKTEENKTEHNKTEHNKLADTNNVFIGGKPFMNYVTAVVMQFTTKNAPDVIVKARGKFISRAVDVAEVASKRFLPGQVGIKDIKINSEEFQNKEGRDVRVSTIEIALNKL